jgi:2-polyprenyl-6-methoxyphenol hydroxylase-like FAD-dependent oxidoreductase
MSLATHKIERHAVVIGGGMAGMLAARVLSDRFTQVSLIERDTYPAEPVSRSGVPQGRHVHFLLVRGRYILDELFPGISERLQKQGAIPCDALADFAIRYPTGWIPRAASPLQSYICTRSLLEWQVRQDLLSATDVQVIEGHEVTALHVKNGAVVGVKMRKRGREATLEEHAVLDLAADLVIDTSGRDSRIMQWLEELGYPQPKETVLNPFLGYSSRFYKPTPDSQRTWKGMIMATDAPKMLRGGVLQMVEGERWMVVLAGIGKDYPPTDPDGFLEFARGMLDPAFYEILKDAEPLSPIHGYRKAENRWRHFEQLKQQPEGLLVMGDAVCSFDPVYGQGMTVAAMGALTLAKCLDQQAPGELTGLARRFQRQLARTNRDPWQLSVGADYNVLPLEEQKRNWLERQVNRYFIKLTALLPTSASLCISFCEVTHLIKPPTSLFRPAIVWKVLVGKKPPSK